MKKFQYKLRTISGQLIEDIILVENREEAIRKLQKENVFLISLEEIKEKSDFFQKSILLSLLNPITRKEIFLFTWQLYVVLNAGAKLFEGLEIIGNEVKNISLKKRIIDIISRVKKGESFSSALNNHSDIFNKAYINSIKAAEHSGKLIEVLKKLADELEKELYLEKRVKSSLVYPVILIFLAFVGIIIILTLILPKFKEIFGTINTIIPFYTKLFFAISDFFLKNSTFIISFIFILLIGILILRKIKFHNNTLDKIKLHLPLFGNLYEKLYAAKLFNTLSLLLNNGVNLINSLQITKEIIENVVFKDLIDKIIINLQKGLKMKEALLKEKRISKVYSYMIGLGEETGTLDETIEKLGNHLQTEVNFALENIVTYIEPIMIFIIGIVIVFVAISIFIPLSDLIIAIKRW
ncbi:MAG TPA: type II secretion system F family protein [bacterium]|nr:type II secretion system F family protein [bacterium]HOL47071.1 type II secretion system F family protein [bacterium]HPQ18971.1 type II secretion system F family protein [bacterium]